MGIAGIPDERTRILHVTKSYAISGLDSTEGTTTARQWNEIYGSRGWKAEYIQKETPARSFVILWKPENTTPEQELEKIERNSFRAVSS